MDYFTVKNKRLKMSPGGLITLPVSARKALGMDVNEGTQVSVVTDAESITLNGNPREGEKTWRISKKGLMELGGEAKALLTKSQERHYWLELDDKNKIARLRPY